MSTDWHQDAVLREEVIRGYLCRRLSADVVARFESHYLVCDECYQELRATQLLMRGLGEPGLSEPILERRRVNDVTVLRFTENTELLAYSLELNELSNAIRLEKDTKVLIDLTRVSRIDSTGLGVLMNCYCHAIKNAGALKLLNPDAPVKRVLSVTKVDSVFETFADEAAAIASFQN
jgi:anti-sigma B factor antagonist